MIERRKITREDLHNMEEVDVVTKWGRGGVLQERLRRARVLNVQRAAARVRLVESGDELLVHFNMLRLVQATPPAAAVQPKRANGTKAVRAEQPQPADFPADREPPPVPPQPVAAPRTPDDIEAWLAMGRELIEPIEARISLISAHRDGITAEIAALEAERDGLTKELAALHAKRERIAAATVGVSFNVSDDAEGR